ncbi:MAG: hypothetical protein GX811_07040, partial [Lentisphaerae bacterium]|nr:hypothetical protein [Lentisphaerota bacterium]
MQNNRSIQNRQNKQMTDLHDTNKNVHGWRIAVGLGACGIAAGAESLFERARNKAASYLCSVGITGCAGACHREPMLELYSPDGGHWTYVHLTDEGIDRIFDEHISSGKPVDEFLLEGEDRGAAVRSFYGKQKRVVLENCGVIDPESLADYQAVDGYVALEKVLKTRSPQQVIEEILASGLRGRGGAGFPTGKKWQFTASAPGPDKVIICNADEGDPGAFMDRGLLESDPHRVIEG